MSSLFFRPAIVSGSDGCFNDNWPLIGCQIALCKYLILWCYYALVPSWCR